jgi:hypothetical protein
MSNNAIEFDAKEITRATESGGLSSGYATLMAESKGMSTSDQQALTQDLVKNGVLPELSFAALDADMKSNGITSIDKQGVDSLKSAADKSGDPLQAAMFDSVASNFDQAAETRRMPEGRFGEMKTAIFADTLDDKIQASATSGSPPETDGSAPATNTDTPAAASAPPLTEQVKGGDSYWSVAERALGLGSKPLDQQQDQQTYDLMKTLQGDNGGATLQSGEIVSIPSADLPQSASTATAPADGAATDTQQAAQASVEQPTQVGQLTDPQHAVFRGWVSGYNGTSPADAPPSSYQVHATENDTTVQEQVQKGDSYWTMAERALGFGANAKLDQQQDQEAFALMQNLQKDNGDAVLQPGAELTVQAGDPTQPETSNATPSVAEYQAIGPAVPVPADNNARNPLSWL